MTNKISGKPRKLAWWLLLLAGLLTVSVWRFYGQSMMLTGLELFWFSLMTVTWMYWKKKVRFGVMMAMFVITLLVNFGVIAWYWAGQK